MSPSESESRPDSSLVCTELTSLTSPSPSPPPVAARGAATDTAAAVGIAALLAADSRREPAALAAVLPSALSEDGRCTVVDVAAVGTKGVVAGTG